MFAKGLDGRALSMARKRQVQKRTASRRSHILPRCDVRFALDPLHHSESIIIEHMLLPIFVCLARSHWADIDQKPT